MLSKNRVPIFLSIVALFLVLLNFSTLLDGQEMIAAIVVGAALIVVSVLARAWFDVGLIALATATFTISLLYFTNTDSTTLFLRVSAILAFVFLHVTLLIGPWSHFTETVLRFYKHRRRLGVATLLLALLHATTVFRVYFDAEFSQTFQSPFVFFGFTGLYIMVLLGLTSWDRVQKNVTVRQWRKIHALTLVIYIAMLVAIVFQIQPSFTWAHFIFIGIFLLVWVLVAPYTLPKKILRVVNGWKQLHVLIYIAYASVIVHVATGVVEQQVLWVQALFWTLVAAVVTSHVMGLGIWWWEYRNRPVAKRVRVQGEDYFDVGAVEDFEEGKGHLRYLADFSVAVFRYRGAFFALDNRCPHQGGPIFRGKIVNGYVECPWHQWQYSVESGAPPPGYNDRISYFPATIHDGRVYIKV